MIGTLAVKILETLRSLGPLLGFLLKKTVYNSLKSNQGKTQFSCRTENCAKMLSYKNRIRSPSSVLFKEKLPYTAKKKTACRFIIQIIFNRNVCQISHYFLCYLLVVAKTNNSLPNTFKFSSTSKSLCYNSFYYFAYIFQCFCASKSAEKRAFLEHPFTLALTHSLRENRKGRFRLLNSIYILAPF